MMGSAERFLIDAVIEDMQKRPPALIVVDTKRDKQGLATSDFDFREYFGTNPRFASEMRDFEPLVWGGGYRFYKRRPR